MNRARTGPRSPSGDSPTGGVHDFRYPEDFQAEPIDDTRKRMRLVPWLLALAVIVPAAAAYGVWSVS